MQSNNVCPHFGPEIFPATSIETSYNYYLIKLIVNKNKNKNNTDLLIAKD